ncbi:MAG: hypothetical protein JSV91_02395 [Phycisphaerales bacterium]|nr:MAG: hypothetical protein JSV91_02395 [Phycisphaerales bacterium]
MHMHKLADLPDLVLAETLAELLREAGIPARCVNDPATRAAPRSEATTVYLDNASDAPAAAPVLAEFKREVVALSEAVPCPWCGESIPVGVAGCWSCGRSALGLGRASGF